MIVCYLIISNFGCVSLHHKALVESDRLAICIYSKRDREDTTRDRDRVKNALGLTSSEKKMLESVRQELNDQIESVWRTLDILKVI